MLTTNNIAVKKELYKAAFPKWSTTNLLSVATIQTT